MEKVGELLVTIKQLSKVFPGAQKPALKEIDAVISKGEITGIAGPDGAGKTTLIRLVAGLLLPTTGSIIIDGKDTVNDVEEIHRLIGYMPQKFGLYEDLSVEQNLELYADLKELPIEEKKETFAKLLHFTGLEPFTKRLAGDLSGGMKQKLGLACALIKKPALLLLDEPSVGVDPISRRELWKMVSGLLEEGVSIIWSTAYLDEAERCHNVLLLSEGELLYNGPPKELTNKTDGRVFRLTTALKDRRELLFDLIQQENVIDCTIQGQDLRVVTKDKDNPPINPGSPLVAEDLRFYPAAPRFEDSFIDILGGGPKVPSKLASSYPSSKNEHKTVVIAEGLTKKFGSFTAANHITLSIQSGEIFGLLGPNGAGKSTTFKMLCGLLKPTSGKASVNGLDLQVAPGEARTHIGYMAQKFSLYGSLSVLENLKFFSGAYNLRGKQQKEEIDQMIDVFKLQPYLNTPAEQLPLGYKQRLSLSCASMHRPEVLFLDEPTSGVDPIIRREFWNHINGLVQKGVTVLVTTHFMDEAEYCDKVALVYRSEVIHIATPDTLKELARSADNPNPTLEDAFIKLIEEYDLKKGRA